MTEKVEESKSFIEYLTGLDKTGFINLCIYKIIMSCDSPNFPDMVTIAEIISEALNDEEYRKKVEEETERLRKKYNARDLSELTKNPKAMRELALYKLSLIWNELSKKMPTEVEIEL